MSTPDQMREWLDRSRVGDVPGVNTLAADTLAEFDRLRRAVRDDADPRGPYAAGWRDALGAAGKCGAYNTDDPPVQYALCVREAGHTGKHDDMWKSWGDRYATAEQNRTDAGDHWRSLRAPH